VKKLHCWGRPNLRRRGFLVPDDFNSRFVGKRDAFLRHPLTLLIAGFLLTGVIGGGFSYWRESRDRSIQVLRNAAAEDTTAVIVVQRGFVEYRLREQLLSRALDTKMPLSEIVTRKRSYDESYVALQIAESANENAIDKAFPMVGTQPVSKWLRFLTEMTTSIDSCLEAQYEAAQSGAITVDPKLPECKFDNHVFPADSDRTTGMQWLNICANLAFDLLGGPFDENSLPREYRFLASAVLLNDIPLTLKNTCAERLSTELYGK
jgi:hypothetical protein